MKFKNYKNSHTNEDTIYSRKNIADMSVREAFSRKDEIMAQHNSIGIPSEGELQSSPNAVWVEPYTRDDGTEVRGHWRSRPQNSGENSAYSNVQEIKELSSLTGGASEIKEDDLEMFIQDNIKNVHNTLYNDKSEVIKNIEKAIMEKEILAQKPEYRSLLYKYFIDVNNDKNKDNPDAQELMNISLIGPKNLPRSIEYKILPYGTGDAEINKVYNIGINSNKYVPSNYFGVEFAEYSSLSKNFSNSKILQEQIKNYYDAQNGKFKSNVIEIDLTHDSQNLQYSIGHCTIFNPQITPDGTFTGDGFDMYNYKYIKPNGSKTVDLNNKAYVLQCAGIIKNYYIKFPVKFKMKK